MKNTFILSGFIAIAMLIAFAGCNWREEPSGKTLSGTVYADDEGKIIFDFDNNETEKIINCKFTTDLPSPDDAFILSSANNASSGKKIIEGLTPEQPVDWTAKSDYYIVSDEQETSVVKIFVMFEE